MIPVNGARDDIAFVVPGGEDVRYGDLPRAMEPWRRLAGERTGKELVALFCDLSLPSIVSYLACLEAGHAVLLADPALTDAATARLLEAYRPGLVLHRQGRPPDGYTRLAQAPAWERASTRETPLHEDLALLMMTSGTTGRPRVAALSHANLAGNAAAIVRALEMSAADRAITSLPLHYCYGLSVLNSHLACGASLVITSASPTSRRFLRLVGTEKVTSMAGVPLTYEALWPLLRRQWPGSLRSLTQAGGALRTVGDYAELANDHDARFWVMYGQTEATARMSVLDTAASPEAIGSVGRAVPGGSFTIDETGEIVYQGPNVMLGYADTREDLALGDRQRGLLRTGDLGALIDGFLYLRGRVKRIVKVAGKRINLDEIESTLNGAGRVAVVECATGMTAYCLEGEHVVRRHAAAVCARLGLPPASLRVEVAETLPCTASGKIDYRRLEALGDRGTGAVAPPR
ncbi:AMP-binding protein [Nonomuraea sp. SBT364]|uniref:AMP-binding protein n=1 Tax=Nonomuraea sp. SBT364 TaxID=1580530 RepID=UPI00066D9361|nr:AMP-binding protein [Nonomuraea sp. SBT364]